MRNLTVRSIYLIVILLTTSIFAGCDQATMMSKFSSPEDESIARNYIDMLRQNKFELIEKDLDSSIKGPDIRNTLVAMAALIPPQQPISVKVIGSQVGKFSGAGSNSSTSNITFEYQFPDKWLMINVASQKKDGGFSIIGFNVNPMADSVENINKFSLDGKSIIQYTVLTVAIFLPLFIFGVLVLCIRTEIKKRKWLWIIFILFGIGQFAVNWTTGQWNINPLQIQLFGAGAFSPLYGAWTVSVSLPIGAIVFLLRRRKLSAPAPIEQSQGLA